MTMTAETTWILLVMITTFVICTWKLKSPEISIFITALVGGIAGLVISGLPFQFRFVVEGMFTYLDLAMIFISATIFVNLYSATGAINTIVRGLVKSFYSVKWILFLILAVLMLIPGALTGAGSVSILVVGGLVGTVLGYMGIESRKITAFVFIMAILAAAAPPINLWAMLMAAGANMPYLGFDVLLIIPVAIITVFTVFFLLRKGVPAPKEEILASLPQNDENINFLKIIIPPVFLIGIILLSKYAAKNMPIIGLPFTFILSALVTWLLNIKVLTFKRVWEVLTKTIEQVFPLVATLVSVGVLVTFITYTGIKGLIGITFITLPFALIYPMVLLFGPIAQGALSYGSAVIIGTPFAFLMFSLAKDQVIPVAALSLIFPIGDCVPPSRITARLAIEATNYEGSYGSFIKTILIPCALLAAYALFMLYFPKLFMFYK